MYYNVILDACFQMVIIGRVKTTHNIERKYTV